MLLYSIVLNCCKTNINLPIDVHLHCFRLLAMKLNPYNVNYGQEPCQFP